MTPLPFYHRETERIRVTVRPAYVAEQSDPGGRKFVFAYFVRIENVGTIAARLLSRRWLIHDANGEDTEVIGDGVIGEQPLLQPGGVHEYSSFSVLKSPVGHMEGHYHFSRADGVHFDALIPRFILDANASTGPVH
ncbi:MAG: Co2+/Mg2+ efflux protein ApaG [Gemmatimonadales bacterium]